MIATAGAFASGRQCFVWHRLVRGNLPRALFWRTVRPSRTCIAKSP